MSSKPKCKKYCFCGYEFSDSLKLFNIFYIILDFGMSKIVVACLKGTKKTPFPTPKKKKENLILSH